MTVDERPNVKHPREPLESNTEETTPAVGTASLANGPSSQRTPPSSRKNPSSSRGITPKAPLSGRAGSSKQGSASKTVSPSSTKRKGVSWDEIKAKRSRSNMRKRTVLVRRPVCLQFSCHCKMLIPAKSARGSDVEDDRDTSSGEDNDDSSQSQSEDDGDTEMYAEDDWDDGEDTDGIARFMKKMEGSLKKTIITTVKEMGGLKPKKGKAASSKKTRHYPRRNHKQQEKDALEEEKAADEAWQRRAFLVGHRQHLHNRVLNSKTESRSRRILCHIRYFQNGRIHRP